MTENAALRTVAPAKVNWTLEVLGRRPDGYHEICSVMQTLSLGDSLIVQRSGSPSLRVGGPMGGGFKGVGSEQNLVMQAARSFPLHLTAMPVAFTLEKSVPVAAGLGGGSSDAAAALRLLARVWRLTDRAAVRRAAVGLGSDVPFFLRGGAQLVEGRGERLSPLPAGRPVHLVLLTPPETIPNKTARLYAELRPAHYTDGAATARLLAKVRAGEAPTADDFVNVFDAVADQVYPRFSEYRRALERATGARALLAGAGPSLFALVEHAARSCRAVSALHKQGLTALAAHTTGPRVATLIEAL
jgi:4-diphosphocytidyl-2-C-methyl-D-erythritol kinase